MRGTGEYPLDDNPCSITTLKSEKLIKPLKIILVDHLGDNGKHVCIF
jgi:hypothetical protein